MIHKTDWHTSEAELVAIRHEVFIDEQHVPIELEIDDHDPHCHHWLAYIDNHPVGTVRMRNNGGIGRMAVRKPFRKQGVGKALLQAAIEYAKEQDWRSLTLSAQDHAIDFYAAQGFKAFGDMFMDAGIPHQSMQLLLRESHKLGHDSAIFLPRDNAATAIDLCQQARRTLRIFSRSLDAAVYARDDIVTALSALARRHRQSEIRLLICDEAPLSESRHPLIELSQRLSSSIPLRVLPANYPAEISEFFILADRNGILVHSETEPDKSWCSYFLPPKVKDYQERFDRMWARGDQPRYLRRVY